MGRQQEKRRNRASRQRKNVNGRSTLTGSSGNYALPGAESQTENAAPVRSLAATAHDSAIGLQRYLIGLVVVVAGVAAFCGR